MEFRVQTLGHSHRDQPIVGYHSGKGLDGGLLILGGTHGDETATVHLLERWLQDASGEDWHFPVWVIPCLNPDGFADGIRYNARGVDLNRNFPTAWSAHSEEPSGSGPLSEPESRLLYAHVKDWRPEVILSLHWALAEIDGDGEQSRDLVNVLWEALNPEERMAYRRSYSLPQSKIDGPPGSFGRWAGHELRYPDLGRPAMVTLELPYEVQPVMRPAILPEDHLVRVKRHYQDRRDEYLDANYPGLCRMLTAAIQFVEKPKTSGHLE